MSPSWRLEGKNRLLREKRGGGGGGEKERRRGEGEIEGGREKERGREGRGRGREGGEEREVDYQKRRGE